MADENLQKLRVVDLRERLSRRGLSTSGLKADLITRLREALENDNKEPGGFQEISVETQEDREGENHHCNIIPDEKVKSTMAEEQKIMDDCVMEERTDVGQKVPGEEEEKSKLISEDKEEKKRMAKEAEETRLAVEAEKKRLAEEEEEERIKAVQEAEKMRQAEEQRRRLEEEEKTRLVMEEHQKRLAEEQQKLLLAQQQQKMLAEQEKLLVEQQQKMIAEQQQLLKEKKDEEELFKLQQQALLEKEEERRQQQQQMLSIPPPPPQTLHPPPSAPLPVPVAPPPLPPPPPPPPQQLAQFSQVLTSTQPTPSSHVQMPPPPPPPLPPPPTVLMTTVPPRVPPPVPVPPPISALSPHLSISASGISPRLPPPPSIASVALQRFSQPPPPVSLPSTLVPPPPSSVPSSLPPPPPPVSLKSTIMPPPPPVSLGSSIPPPPVSINSSMPPPPPPVSLSSTILRPPPSSLNSSMPPPPPASLSSSSMPPPPPVSSLSSSMPPPPASLSSSMPPPPASLSTSMPPPPSTSMPPPASTTIPPPASTTIPPPPGALNSTIPPPSVSLNSSVPPPPLPVSSNLTTQSASTPRPTVPPPPSASQATSTSENGSATPVSNDAGKTQTPAVKTTNSSEESSNEIKLPQALEKVLAFKTERAEQLGVDPDAVQAMEEDEDMVSSPTSKHPPVMLVVIDEVDEDENVDDDEKASKSKETKSKRNKKKKRKRQRVRSLSTKRADSGNKNTENEKEKSVDIDIEYVQDVLDVSDPMYSQFIKVFEKFKLTEPEKAKNEVAMDTSVEEIKQEAANKAVEKKKPADLVDDDDDDDDDDEKDEDAKKDEEEKPKLSKRKLKKLSRMSVAELKQKVSRPELVEMHDITAKDPVLLLHLKASRNTVPVPRHWCFKRKYLQGKRGIEKPAFELPDFIKRTGIMEMRQALQEKEDQKTMKAKMRERVRPKLGKIDIDYQKLHDAFFKWQTKPKMTIHGDLYYEGKEFETRLKEKKPGDLSEELRVALGMPTGPNANKCPPPWLIAMQRYGPPPSYPNLKIPGLNAPIPDGCSFGYHAGGWGKPPVDEAGKPLYGDVFGTQMAENQPQIQEEEIDHTLWGELESESSEEEEDEDEEDEEEDEGKTEDETGLVTPAEGLITPSGFSSIPAGMETPDMIELRKRKIEAEMEGGETPALYTILPEKKTDKVGNTMMGSTHIYDLAAAIPAGKIKMPGTASVPPQGIEVALDPSELELDSAAMAARYEQTVREQQSQLEKEDLSDMVAEHAARQKNKRKKQQQDSGKAPKKYKEFKF